MNRLEVCKKLENRNLLCRFNDVLSQSFVLYRGPLNYRSIIKRLGNVTHVLISCGASEQIRTHTFRSKSGVKIRIREREDYQRNINFSCSENYSEIITEPLAR